MEKEFISRLENLFDISHADSRNLIKIPEDWLFLQDQLKARKMIIFGEDAIFEQREQRKQKRMCKNPQRQEKKSATTSLAKHFTSIFDSEEEDASIFDDFIGDDKPELEISKYHLNIIENKIEFCTAEPTL